MLKIIFLCTAFMLLCGVILVICFLVERPFLARARRANVMKRTGLERSLFLEWRSPRRGTDHPHDMTNNVWKWLVEMQFGAYDGCSSQIHVRNRHKANHCKDLRKIPRQKVRPLIFSRNLWIFPAILLTSVNLQAIMHPLVCFHANFSHQNTPCMSTNAPLAERAEKLLPDTCYSLF